MCLRRFTLLLSGTTLADHQERREAAAAQVRWEAAQVQWEAAAAVREAEAAREAREHERDARMEVEAALALELAALKEAAEGSTRRAAAEALRRNSALRRFRKHPRCSRR